MELQQLRYVLAVAETRNFTRAAAQCFVVQSALSHQVKALETELGVQLFARTSRRVELTQAGAAFLPSARACLEAAARARSDALATTGRIHGTLTVGVIPTVTALDLPATLSRLRRAHPDVHVTLEVAGSHELIAGIRAGAVDLAVLGLPDDDVPRGVATEVLSRDRLVAVLPEGHRLAARKRLRLRDLAEETFADFPAGSPGRAQSDLAFAAAEVSRSVGYEVLSAELILDLVAEGLAVTLLVPAVVGAHPGLVTVPVRDGPTRVEYLAWSDFNPSPATRACLDLLGHTGRKV